MKVLMVSSLWPPTVVGGAEIYAERLTTRLREQGVEVGVVTLGVDGEHVVEAVPPWPYRLDQFAEQPPWRRAMFRAVDVYNPVARRALARAVSTFGPDVVHTHSVAGLSTTAMASPRRSPAAHVHTLHDYWLLCRRTTFVKRSGEACERRCVSCTAISTARSALLAPSPPELVIAPSTAVADRHAGLGWMSGRIRRVNHPVERRPARTRPPAADGGPVTFGFAGQLTATKGVATLLRAFRPLGQAGHQLVLAGRGPLLDEARAAGPGVTALGWVAGDELEAFYDGVDCLVVPSEWPENAPLVVLEARARCLPVIGARIGGIPEIVESASHGLLFRSGDETDLRIAMLRFAGTPQTFIPSAPSGMSWDEHTAAILDVYSEAISAKRAQP